jgi:SNF2 family DNA or RNA helicase
MSSGFESADRTGGFRWRPAPPPTVIEIPVILEAVPWITGFNRALARPPQVKVHQPPLVGPPPRVISVPIQRTSVRVKSYRFAEPSAPGLEDQAASSPKAGGMSPAATARPAFQPGTAGITGTTRIKPPRDVIKLEDRLHYLLQPPLEVMLAERALEFPMRPFAHQMEGIAFLYPRHAAVLADEMGLGKTMQAIMAVRLLVRSGTLRSVLLVCPKPLVSNWQRELEFWAPEIPVMAVEGDQAKRLWQWQLPGVPIKIANYELLHRDREVFEARDASGKPPVRFDLVVLDESQRIKNRASATSQAARAIPRSRNWALTGTPMENSPEDLVGIFEFLAPGVLHAEMRPRRMRRVVRDYVLRRTKEQVLKDLPPKLFRDAELELTPQQYESYRLAEKQGVLRLAEMGEAVSIQHVFELVLRLKQIANFDPATGASSKLERLEANLEEIAQSGRKAIVFSQWVETLTRLARALKRFGPVEYHGRIPPRRRDAVIRQFREAPDRHVLLISYGAGGVGLNLQFADYVFLFDRWWNPAVEDQAINRAHRIGVAGPVTVTRFLVLGTIEERIDHILQEKRDLFDMIFSGAQGPRKLGLTQQELFGLFDLTCPGGPIKFAA